MPYIYRGPGLVDADGQGQEQEEDLRRAPVKGRYIYRGPGLVDPPKPEPLPDENRSIPGDIAAALAGGLVDLAEMGARASRQGRTPEEAPISSKIIEGAEHLQEAYPVLRPSTEAQTSEPRRWIYEGTRMAIPSLGAGIPGGVGGFLLGGVPVAAIGAGTTAAAVFGIASYDEFLEDVREYEKATGQKLDPDLVHSKALKTALVEGGFEGLSQVLDIFAAKVGGRAIEPLKAIARKHLKTGAKEVTELTAKGALHMDKPGKEAAKALAGTTALATPGEVGTEMAQSYFETKFRNDVGLQAGDPIEAAKDVIGPTVFMTFLFGMGSTGFNHRTRKMHAEALSDPKATPKARVNAIKAVNAELARYDQKNGTNYAEQWAGDALKAVAEGRAIGLDENVLRKYGPTPDKPKREPGAADVSKPGNIITGEGTPPPGAPPGGAGGPAAAPAETFANTGVIYSENIPAGVEEPAPIIPEQEPEQIADEFSEDQLDEILSNETNTEPSEAQVQAGNYKKGHMKLHGLDISIENPKGSVRKGVDKSGKPWENEIKHHYGYIRGTVGKDKDHLDVFLGPNLESTTAYVINQKDPETGKFDETKTMLGFNSREEAEQGYLDNYEEGWQGLGSMVETSMDEFKAWAKGAETKKPYPGGKRPVGEPTSTQVETVSTSKEVSLLDDYLALLRSFYPYKSNEAMLKDMAPVRELAEGIEKAGKFTAVQIDLMTENVRDYLKGTISAGQRKMATALLGKLRAIEGEGEGSSAQAGPAPEVVATFRNDEVGWESTVRKLKDGRFSVQLKDLGSGNTLPASHIFPDEERAIEDAQRSAGVETSLKTPKAEEVQATLPEQQKEFTGGGKEQAAGVLGGEKEPWEMTRDEYDARRISIINPEMGFEVTDTEIQSVGKAGGVQGQMQTKNKKIVRRKNADSGVTTHEIRHLIDEKHGIHNAVVQFINAAKGRSQQLREWLYSRGYIHAGRSGHFDTRELTEAVINEYLSDPAGMEKIVPELKSLLDLTDLTNYKDFNISHRQQIKKALSEGKPVPPEVLKDYPNLVKTSLKTPEVAPEEPKDSTVPEKTEEARGAEAEKTAAPKRRAGKSTTVRTEAGTKAEVQYAVVDAADLITSHDTDLSPNENYPQELQPRDRERAASREQILRMLSGLDPELLGENPKASDGAPVVGSDNVVESGNGRTIALKLGYEKGHDRAKGYKKWLSVNAERFGLDKRAIESLDNPVLVRVRTSEIDRVKFAQEANVSGQAAMSPVEIAVNDAKILIDSSILAEIEITTSGDINTAKNTRIIRDFISRVAGKSEIGNYVTKEGLLSQAAITRMRNAMFAAAYGNTSALEVISESIDDDARNISRGLLIAAPAIARVKVKALKGVAENVDITPLIVKAAEKYRSIKESGETIEEYLGQLTMFGGMDPATSDILKMFEENKRSGIRIGKILKSYADLWDNLGDPRQALVFGKSERPEPMELFGRAKEIVANEEGKGSGLNLFQDQAVSGQKAEKPSQVQAEPEEQPETVAPAASLKPELTIEDYSDKSFVVRGNTKEHKDRIKAAGKGIFSIKLKGGPGWVFGLKQKDKVREALKDLLGESLAATKESTSPKGRTSDPRSDLERKGATRVGEIDYTIQQADTGHYYYTRTEKGIRVEHGGAGYNVWSREKAIEEALEEISHDLQVEALRRKPAAEEEKKPGPREGQPVDKYTGQAGKTYYVDGKPVPPEVLKDYPELTQKPHDNIPGEKEPWEITRDEFVDSHDFYKNTIRARYFDEKGMRLPGSSRTTHWEGKLPPVGTWRWDRGEIQNEDFGIAQLREIDPNDPKLQLREVDNEGRLDPAKRADVQQYADWYKEGKRPYPIEVAESLDGRLVVTDGHRRVLAAREAGVPILAWVEPPNKNDMPMRRRDAVEQALAEGKPVPPEVLKDYPELTQKPHDNIPDVSVQKKVTVDQKAPEIEPQPLTIKISGGMVQTKSGRQIPAPIKVRLDSGRKATNDLKKQESWMREQALAEAKARGDEYNALQFNGMKPGKMTRANKDHAMTYLFGDSDVEFEVEQATQQGKKAEPKPPATESATPHGWVEIKGKQRPFTTYREILRGKNKGMYRVSVGGKGYLVDKGKIARFPEGALGKEIAKVNIAVDEQRAVTRQSLKKDHPDWSAQRVKDELAKTVRAGEEAGVSEANERIGKPAVKRSLFDKKAVRQTSKQTIEDFGEKIGGARKDLAESGVKKSASPKKESGIPAWKNRFVAGQKVNEPGVWVIMDKKNPFGGSRQKFSSQEEAEAAIPVYAVASNHMVRQSAEDKYSIYKRVGDRKIFKVVNQDFPSREEAMKHMALHAEEILNIKTTFGEEILPIPEKVQREGAERRKGPSTPDMFMETFKPRAIEFGNWNNQEERQRVMDYAYDGLLDLADTLGIPPKALMLDGDLAIAFGARGHGLSGARAHYEPEYGVINLTKMKGAGSLAHEWFHALDHYFARLDTKADSERVTNKRGDLVYPESSDKYTFITHGASYKTKLRPEIQDAYKSLVETMYRKAEQYVEDTKRADAFLAAARKNLREELDSVRRYLERDSTQYIKNKFGKPASAEQLAEFDRLADILAEGGDLETKYISIESSSKRRRSFAASGRYSNNTLEGINNIMKAAKNRQGFNSEHTGLLDRVRIAMNAYSARLKMFEDAKAGTEKTKKVPTNYAIEAKKMDQARTGEYWGAPHEMAARAFSSYVEDKIAERGEQSDFIVYQAHGGIVLPMIDGFVARPYPEGSERTAINNAFDNLVKTFNVRETDKGIALFRKSDPTNTPAFKEWFGNSKVVDENGKPLVVYRGMSVRRDPNLPASNKGMTWFTNDRLDAEDYNPDQIVETYLSVTNPADLDSKAVKAILKKAGLDPEDLFDLSEKGPRTREVLQGAGYDGAFVSRADIAEGVEHYAAFSPTQIKSINNQGTFDPENPNILMRKGTPSGIPIPAVNRSIDPILSKWKGAPKIVVTNSKDTKIPKGLMRQMGDAEGVAGAFYEDTVYLFHDNIDSIEDAQKTILHEVIAHWGLRQTFGSGFDSFLGRLYADIDKTRLQPIAEQYGLDLSKRSDQLVCMEEYLALLAEKGEKPSVWKRFIAWVRTWLMNMGFKLKTSQSDVDMLIASAIGKARRYVQDGTGYAVEGFVGGEPLLRSVESIQRANRTSRGYGAVGSKAITPRYVESIASPSDKILDFGAGKGAVHAADLRGNGLNVTAYDFGSNVREGLHDPDALSREYDIVYASNVLNVQSGKEDLIETLEEIASAVRTGGRAVFNFPGSPRFLDMDAVGLAGEIRKVFGNAPVRVGGTKAAPLFEVVKNGMPLFRQSDSGKNVSVTSKKGPGDKTTEATPQPDGGIADDKYLAAIEDGKFNTAQKMVNEAFGFNQFPKTPLPDKQISEIAWTIDLEWPRNESTRRYLRNEYAKDLEEKGIEFIDAYHVTDAEIDTLRSHGIKGTALDYIGRSEGNTRESSVYLFLDPDDIPRGYIGILGSKNNITNIIHVQIPVREIEKMVWDSNFNVSFGTYSAVGMMGDVPAKWIKTQYKYAPPFITEGNKKIVPLSKRLELLPNQSRPSEKGGSAFIREIGIPAPIGEIITSHYNNIQVKKHPDYAAAKKGDNEAAVRLVRDMVKPDTAQAVKDRVGGGAIFVYPHAIEEGGVNAIPAMLAGYYAEQAGGTLDDSIVQNVRAFHTGAKAMERLIARATFTGDVVEGGRYVLVDDVTTMGGTLAELANHIQDNGGVVVGVATLTNASRSRNMTPSKQVLSEIERRYGSEIREQFNIEPSALTAAEAGYLLGFRDADSLRNRATAARQERAERLRAKGVRPEEVTRFRVAPSPTETPLDTKSLFPEVQERMEKSRGLGKQGSIKERALLKLEETWHAWRRHFPQLDPAKHGKFINILRLFEAVPNYSKTKARDVIKDILGKMNEQEFSVFSFNVILEDMMKDVESGLLDVDNLPAGETLPFGYTSRAQVEQDLEHFKAQAAKSSAISEALDRRDEYVQRMREDLVHHGLLDKSKLDDPAYFHHQVLEMWAIRKWTGSGVGTMDVRTHKKGWQIARKGSLKDYNTDYIESEFEVLAQGIAQIETKKTLDRIDREANIVKSLRGRARAWNESRALEIFEEKGLVEIVESQETGEIKRVTPFTPLEKQIAVGFSRLHEMASEGILEGNDEFSDVIDSLAEEGENSRVFGYLAWLLKNDAPGAMEAARIFKGIKGKEALIKSTLGDQLKTFRDLIPEGYAEWKPEPGSAWYLTNSITDKVLDQIRSGERSFDDQETRKILARGVDAVWVVPEELAVTLNDFRSYKDEGPLGKASQFLVNSWKQWVLINPYRVLKYNLNNMSGDFDICWAYDPKIIKKYMWKAGKDLLKYVRNQEISLALKEELDTAFRKDVLGSSMTVHDITDITEHMALDGYLDVMAGRKVSAISRFWNTSKKYTTYRENILRLATYRYFKDRIAKGDKVYGASNRDVVDSIRNRDDRAALLARELVGDYGNLTVAGQWLRTKMIPFYSWCVPEYTEILTREGWKTYDQLRVGEEALTYNIQKRTTEWQEVQDKAAYPFDGDLVTIQNSYGFKYQFTEDHRVVVIEKYKDQRKVVLAKDLKTHQHIPLVSPHEFTGESVLSETDAALLGWLVTDGYFRVRAKSPNSFEAMLYQKKPSCVDLIRSTFAEYISSESVHPDTGVICFRLKASKLDKIRKVFKSKDDLPGIATQLGERACQAMYDAMLAAEGTSANGFVAFPQNNGPVLDAFQILCYMLGKAGHIRPKTCKGKEQHSLYVKKGDKIQLSKWKNTREHYNGMVWCPKTENGTWIMRQNGKVMITGNCEINAPRYVRMFYNLPIEGEGRGNMAEALTMKMARKTVGLTAKAFTLYGMVVLWNMTVAPLLCGGDDPEEELSDFERRQLHLILGRREDGSILTVRFQGALSDALAWFGLEGFPRDIKDLSSGKKTGVEQAKEMFAATPNRIVNASHPFIKMAAEELTGYSTFPDIFHPRPIRDKVEHLARMFSLDSPYRHFMGKPTRGDWTAGQFWDDVINLVGHSSDTGEAAYFDTRAAARRFMERKGVNPGYFHADSNSKSAALYNYKRALQYGDLDVAKKYLDRYMELGGSRQGLKASVRLASPEAWVPKKFRAEFRKSLTESDRVKYDRAMKWYRNVYYGGQ